MSTVLNEIKDHVAVITLNRPEALNALSTAVLTDLNKTLDEIEKAKDVYAVIITGAGDKSFVAGAFGNKVFSRIENFRCPVIAAINGFALGGGCELAMSCDIRIASNKARFAQPEVGLGITPGFGGTQRLARLIGAGKAKELIYTCRQVKADEALSIGLVNLVTEPEKLMEEAMNMAKTISAQAPIAVKCAKQAINEGLQKDMQGGIAIEVEKFSDCFVTEDQKMAMGCFVNKQKVERFNNK